MWGRTEAEVLPRRGPQAFRATLIRDLSRRCARPLKAKELAFRQQFPHFTLVLRFYEEKQVDRFFLC